MFKKNPSIFFKTLMLCFILTVFSVQIYPRIWCNTIDSGFSDDGVLAGFSMKTHNVEAAAHFLNTYGYSMLLLNKIELSELYGLNFAEAQELVQIASQEIKYAIDEFTLLRDLADRTPYNKNVLDLVAVYDYDAFEFKKNANTSILENVKIFLTEGKIREFYAEMHLNLLKIADHLNLLKNHLDGNIYPDFETIHNLNQILAETMVSGEYAAEIFHEVVTDISSK